jgi:glycosyltransferase involved in cell wall biosynthesis
MDYFPNVDAVVWFCDEILPLVQKQVPESTFTICGSQPAADVRRLSKRRGVTVTGRVPDIRPYLDRAEVFVAPLRMGRGIQNKLLEALAMGLPCVASTAAWSGTLVPKEQGVLVSDNPREFAEEIVCLLRDGDYRSAMARRARVAAETHCRWEEQMSHLDQVIEAVTVRWRPSVSSPVERP